MSPTKLYKASHRYKTPPPSRYLKKIMKGGIELQGESFSDQIFLKYYGILKKNSGGGCGSGNEK